MLQVITKTQLGHPFILSLQSIRDCWDILENDLMINHNFLSYFIETSYISIADASEIRMVNTLERIAHLRQNI